MSPATREALLAAALAGAATGARSLTPLALLAAGGLLRVGLPEGPRWIWSAWTARALGFAAAGEIAADKLADLPSRTAPVPLAGRVVLGGLLGVLAARKKEEPVVLPALVAAATAAASAGALTRGRAALAGRGVPDAAVGLVEDALVIGLTAAADDLLRKGGAADRQHAEKSGPRVDERPGNLLARGMWRARGAGDAPAGNLQSFGAK